MDLAEYLIEIANTYGPVLPLWGVAGPGVCGCKAGKNCKQSKGKHPNGDLVPNGVKNASRDPSVIREWVKRAPKGNWGVATGHPLPGGGFLGVLDVDPRNGGNETIKSVGPIPETARVESGGGGLHYYFRCPVQPASCSKGPGLDWLGYGKYCLIDPSSWTPSK